MKFFFAAALAVSSAFFASPANADCCRPEDHRTITKLDLYESTVVTNELHLEHGELRYNNVGVFEDNTLDLVVTITSGDYTDITDEWDRQNKAWPNTNGKNDKFGVINLQTSRDKPYSGRGNFRFCLVQEGTDIPVTLETFSFTVYDTDERGDDDTKAGIGIKERLFMDTSQVASYQLIEGSEIVVGCEDGSTPSPNCPDGVRTLFHSSTAGTGKDNPSDPNILTDKQKKRSIGFNFDDTSCWEFTYDHYCPVDQPGYEGDEIKCRWYGGGNFLFAGTSDIIVNEGKCNPTPTPAPTYPPTEPPTKSPSGSPTASPSGSPTKRPTYPPTESPSGSPTNRPTEPPTASPSGSPTDSPTEPPTESPSASPTTSAPTEGQNPGPPICDCDAGDDIGSYKCGNVIYVCPGVTDVCETSGNVYFPITQEECDAMKLLEINDDCPAFERFGVPSQGLDHRVCYSTKDGITSGSLVDVVCCETCEPDPVDFSESPTAAPTCGPEPTDPPTITPSESPTKAPVDPPSFPPTPEDRDDTCECDVGDDIGSFKCSNYIYVCPGVTEVCETSRNSDYYPITQEECDAMKLLEIDDPCPALERYNVPSRELSHRVCYSTTDGVTTGFKVDVVCCDTCEPDPVDFSESPTVAPTEGHDPGPPTPVCPIPDPDPVPETCPEDVEVIQQVGVTPIVGVDAVSIISQDTDFVTVSLKQAWTEGLDLSVDQIYYQYKSDYLDEDCYPALEVPGTCHYAEITIQCYAHKPFAELEICVADNGGALQSGGDTATIPKCCHAEVPDDTPTVCYKLVINCETECVDSVERRALRGAAN